ncbi:MAG: RdgB/HAM1 family non-canonical purine NTP pyrophosphatase [Rhodobacteraceae bacterium]|nr:RdgB/HAM1 family non-canonical purine NTP pyrophosphatase [Paracoccaceae bacterium]
MTRKFTGTTLLMATHNTGKLEETQNLLQPRGITVTGAADHNLATPQETADTFIGNARLKAHTAAQATGLPALADDSGIEIDALNGAPGVHTADWAEALDGRDFVMAMTRTHKALEALNASHPRMARFCCTLVLAWPDGHDEVFPGRVEGHLTWPIRGDKGHGYDPIFVPQGYDITFGEMERWDKNKISHRADAVARLLARCFA